MNSESPIINFLDYAEYTALEERLRKQRVAGSRQGFEIWAGYDSAVRSVMRNYGKVGSDADVDFYHSGDWFHELSDGFALLTTTALSVEALQEFQKVVANHHPNAVLSLVGDLDTPIFGFEILVTSTAVYAAWDESTAEECRSKLRKAGLRTLC